MSLTRLTLVPLLAFTMTANSHATDPDARLYELRVYYAAPGKLDALHSRFRDHTLKLFEKHGITNIGYFTPVENPEDKLIYLLAYPNAAARTASWAGFMVDPDMQRAFKESEANGRLVAKFESLFLRPTEYSPAVHPSATSEERTFELRTYTATPGNLDNLNARFRDHTIKLFEKHGMINVGYWTLASGDGLPKANPRAVKHLGGVAGADQNPVDATLIYLLAHTSAAARDRAFDAFRSDPKWKAALSNSEKNAGGSLTAKNGVKSLMLKPTDYSPMR